MNVIIKVLTVVLGYHLLGFIGAILGFILASLALDRPLAGFNVHIINPDRTQQTFFNATFAVMGCIAKADGRISEREIQVARMLMEQMGLIDAGKQRAIEAFTLGKQANFNLESTLQTLKQLLPYPHLLQLFIDIQVQAAYADGNLSHEKKQLLQHIVAELRCSPLDFDAIEAARRGQSYSDAYDHRAYPGAKQVNLAAAYSELGIPLTASEAEIKRAYRKLMSQYHPDKLISKGFSSDRIKVATEKTQRIQKAYEQIKQARGM